MLGIGIAVWVILYTLVAVAVGILIERSRWNRLINMGYLPRPRTGKDLL